MVDAFRNIRDRISKEGFVKNVFLLSSGAFINIALNIFLTPIVTRIYSREDYGFASLFLSIVNIAVLVVTLMYPSAIVIPKENEKAYALVKITFVLIAGSTVLALLTYATGIHAYFYSGDLSAYASWVFLIPVAIIVVGFDQTTASLNVRDKEFKLNAKSNIVAGALNKGVTIGSGLAIGSSQFGIIAGFLISHFLSSAMRIGTSFKQAIRSSWNLKKLKETAVQFINYPRYILPGDFINRFSRDSPLYFFTLYYDMALVGSLAFAISMLTIPYNLIGASVSPVFIQKAGELRDQSPERLKEFVTKLNRSLFLTGILPFAIVVVFGGELFAFVFSEQWYEAGVFAGFLSVYFMFRLITSPMSSIFRVLEKERITLVFNVFLFIGRIAVLFIASLFFEATGIILAFSIFSAVAYITLMILTFRLVNLPWATQLFKYVVLFYAVIGVLWGIKYLIANLIT
jgi:O-antigen/teichoic acid export membrane protein